MGCGKASNYLPLVQSQCFHLGFGDKVPVIKVLFSLNHGISSLSLNLPKPVVTWQCSPVFWAGGSERGDGGSNAPRR